MFHIFAAFKFINQETTSSSDALHAGIFYAQV
nr:MAG TPA: hypothetical protein [Caudoviricetes sp.]